MWLCSVGEEHGEKEGCSKQAALVSAHELWGSAYLGSEKLREKEKYEEQKTSILFLGIEVL